MSGQFIIIHHEGTPKRFVYISFFITILLLVIDHTIAQDCNSCSLSLVESTPEGLIYDNDALEFPSTFSTWLDLVESATESIDIGSYYWTLLESEVYPNINTTQGELIFDALLKTGRDRGIKIRIAQDYPSDSMPNTDTQVLVAENAAEVRSLNFPKLLGYGVLHTKMWIVDQKHVYIGSANLDWRALTQVKELGILVKDCPCVATDLSKIFEVYWTLGQDDAEVPSTWPDSLATNYNIDTPLNLIVENETFHTYITSAPPQFSPQGRTDDIEGLLSVIQNAEEFIYIAVMDYLPLMLFRSSLEFWPVIDDALKTVAIEKKVKVRLLISKWVYSRSSIDYFLKSLTSVNNSYSGVSIEARRFIVPADEDQAKIPYARVNHNKFMVTDKSAFIGTSNWSGDYFTDTAGVSVVMNDPVFEGNDTRTTIRSQLQAVFERDWNSNYSEPLDPEPAEAKSIIFKGNILFISIFICISVFLF